MRCRQRWQRRLAPELREGCRNYAKVALGGVDSIPDIQWGVDLCRALDEVWAWSDRWGKNLPARPDRGSDQARKH